MKIERNWYLLLSVALSAAAAAAITSKLLRRQRPTAHLREHAPELKSWENEGGNLAPIQASSAPR
jgi:hypothetical protein